MACCLKIYALKQTHDKKPFYPILGAAENYWYRHPIELYRPLYSLCYSYSSIDALEIRYDPKEVRKSFSYAHPSPETPIFGGMVELSDAP